MVAPVATWSGQREGDRARRLLAGPREGSFRGAGVFEDDIMLPEQYFARLRLRADYPGEQRLLLAVLEDAVHCFQTNIGARTPRRRNIFEQAEEWLLGGPCDALVTFDYVCDVFGMDAEYMRAGIRRWRDRHLTDAGAVHDTAVRAEARGACDERDEQPEVVLDRAVGA